MPEARLPPPILFLDFDGTITERDATDLLLEKFADQRWLEIEADWQAGRIGSRECLREQMALVRARPDEVDHQLDSIRVDHGFIRLLETCVELRVPLHIVSDGFDYCIRRILSQAGFQRTRGLALEHIFSSRLMFDDGRWRVDFPFSETCAHGCATCKPGLMRRVNKSAARTIFVGDGLSDRYAAAEANLVFAKAELARYCQSANLPYVFYEDLGRVAIYLESLLDADQIDVDAPARMLEAPTL